MADYRPIKANLTSGNVTSLGEVPDGDSLPVALGGTGATTAAGARTALGAAALNGDPAQPFSMASLNGGPLGGLRNKLINGNFAINQDGNPSVSTAYAAGVYIRDGFKAGAGGCTVSFSTTANVTTATITAGTMLQIVEGLNLQSGTHTLSWTGTAQGRVDGGAYAASGVQGVAVGGTNQTVEWGTGTVSKPQYEPGAVATPTEIRPFGMDLMICQRYYEKGVVKAYLAGVTAIALGTNFIVPKRSVPTIVKNAPPAGGYYPGTLEYTTTTDMSNLIQNNPELSFQYTASARL